MAAWKCHSSSCSLVKGSCIPALRASTSKVVTHAITTSSQPDVRAITSSNRRKPSESLSSASMLRSVLVVGSASVTTTPFPDRSAGKRPRGHWIRAQWLLPSCRRCVAGAALPYPPRVGLVADVARLHGLRVAPDRVLFAEGKIVIGDLLEERVLFRLFLDDLRSE